VALQQSPSIAAIRHAVPAVTSTVFLNTGTYGPLPTAAFAAMVERERRDLEHGRSNVDLWPADRATFEEIQPLFARVAGCAPEEIALQRGTTFGMNTAVWGLDWRPGDEIVVSDLEHIGGLAAAYNLRERLGVGVRFAACEGAESVSGAIREQITPRTRAIVCSHVAWGTGFVFPIAELAEAAHAAGALLFVDGAQSAGAVPLDMRALGVDAYAMPGQKWLCGPGDTGALYVSPRALERLHASFGNYASFESFDEVGAAVMQPGARRFELGVGFVPAVFGLRASLRWIVEEVGLDFVQTRTAELADYARERLAGVDGVDAQTPIGTRSGLTHFTFAGWEPMAVAEELFDRGIVIRAVSRPPGLRCSTGFYNNHDDVDRLADGLKSLHGAQPHASRNAAH